jgi:hypothetical protein
MANYFTGMHSVFKNAVISGLFTDGISWAFCSAEITVLSIYSIMRPSLSKYYVPISWLMILVSMSLLSLTFAFDRWSNAIGFTAAYGLFLLAAPILIFIIGIDATCAIIMATPILLIELFILLTLNKLLPSR